MVVCIVLIVLGVICLTLFLIEKIRKYSVKATMIKATTSFLFIALAAYSFYKNGSPRFGVYVICALAMGMLGDIWLGLKYAVRNEEDTFTFAGFCCFGVGHILYITGMMTSLPYPTDWYAYLIPIALGLLSGGAVILLEKPLKCHYGKYKLISCVYGALLFTMMFTALYLAIATKFQEPAFIMLFVGGVLFAVSDLILCGTYFSEGKERPVDLISNAVTYYAAQYIIAFSLFFLVL